jgi:hypothetical protein
LVVESGWRKGQRPSGVNEGMSFRDKENPRQRRLVSEGVRDREVSDGVRDKQLREGTTLIDGVDR